MKKILVDCKERPTIDEILQHPWMVSSKLSEKPIRLNFEKLKRYATFSKLKKLALSFIATQVPENEIKELGALFRQIDRNGDGYLTS